MKNFQKAFIVLHFSLMMMFFGGAILETFVNYPNWFRDVPASLEVTRNFLQVRNPGNFFQIIFPLTILSGIVFVILAWQRKAARNWILFSILLGVAIEALTIGLIYPKIGIMINEGAQAHSAEMLKQTAQEFVRLHWFRMIAMCVSIVASLNGFLSFFRQDEIK
jgi:hypothetical protein